MADPREPDDEAPDHEAPDDEAPDHEASDPGADTDAWRAFAEAAPEPEVEAHAESDTSPVMFRVLTLLAGLLALGAIIWLLLQ